MVGTERLKRRRRWPEQRRLRDPLLAKLLPKQGGNDEPQRRKCLLPLQGQNRQALPILSSGRPFRSGFQIGVVWISAQDPDFGPVLRYLVFPYKRTANRFVRGNTERSLCTVVEISDMVRTPANTNGSSFFGACLADGQHHN